MPSSPPPPPIGTVFETDEEILQAQGGMRTSGTEKPRAPSSIPNSPIKPSPRQVPLPPKPVEAARPVENYRPTSRPQTALLVVCDDGRTEGDIIRLRSDRFEIGRTEGDLIIPHDSLISGRHVEITRQSMGGRYRWVVTDLNSMNGLFVRVSRAVLSDLSEILVGRGRYRLECPETATMDHIPEGHRS